MRQHWLCAGSLAALFLVSCGSGSPIETDLVGYLEMVSEATLPDVVPETRNEEDTQDLWSLDTRGTGDLVEPELVDECQPGDGCFLDPCGDGNDCLSGICVDHMGDSVCTVTCVEECPDGWLCEQIGAGPDAMFACVSPYTHLCRPCTDNGDCESATGIEDVCVDYGPAGRFCGALCGDEMVCPPGYACEEAPTVGGSSSMQCVNEDGVCPCSHKAVQLALTTPCFVSNEFGTCTGLRVCVEEGLTDCDAPTPAAEVCDGVDNDCDGGVDNISCDDDDDCTQDSCDPAVGCVHAPLQGTACDDGNVCTLADHCDSGACVGSPIDCDDDNPCTSDSCDPSGGCVYTFNSAPCDDGDPCTINDACKQGSCNGFAIPCECQADADCLVYEDGDVCNGTLVCDLDAFPAKCVIKPGSVVSCPQPQGLGAECLAAACDPLSGACSFHPGNNGGACSDGNACTVAESCQEGLCQGGLPVNCNDGNVCTDDSCDPTAGCQHTDNTSPCNDGDACSTGDACTGGICAGKALLNCDDGNPCTDDSCDPVAGCLHAANSVACNDGNPCTTGDTCTGGACLGTGTLDCNDGKLCTTDSCSPDVGCVHQDNTLPCNDNNACTTGDTCNGGACLGTGNADCDDGNVCTDDSCDPATGCVHVNNSDGCNDNNTCTTNDLCVNGTCQGSGSLECDDGNPCTKDICLPAGGCEHQNVAGACSDGDGCTTEDSCQDGLCVGGPQKDCDDGNVCTDDSCTGEGLCVHEANSAACDDGNACTTGDHCQAGACTHEALVECDDDNVCTTDSCDPQGGCQYAFNAKPCNDSNACTTQDLCTLGECLGTGPLACDDGNPCTDDSCSPALGCQHTPNQAACDDGNACTTGDHCAGGNCVAAGTLDCNDDDLCTNDACVPGDGCVYTFNSNPCNDGDLCTINDVCSQGLCGGQGQLNCNDGNLCTDDSCDPAAGCLYTNNSVACDDGNACTGNDQCANGVCGGEAVVCNDSNLCTDDSCNPASGCVFAPNTNPCDDGNACTLQDACAGGGCVGGPAPDCDDGNLCTDDSCNPLTGCVHGHNVAPCDDGNACTVNDVCAVGVCGGEPLTCNDGNQCTQDSCDVELGCIYSPITPCCGNGAVEAGEECDDGNTQNGDGCDSNCQDEIVCGGWWWNNACWYTGSLGQSCNQVCASHCGFDQQGSQHVGNQVGMHFWPGKADGDSDWSTIECSSTDNNTNWPANGGTPNGNWSFGACHPNCACDC